MVLEHKIVSNEIEFDSFRESVAKAGLPYQDLNYQNQILISYFSNGAPVGTVGLEIINQYGLLRSVSVSTEYRNKAIGKQILTDIINNARGINLEAVYLITETAKDYFEKLGFETVDREAVPIEIKSTTQFSQVCPVSAICMVMRLRSFGMLWGFS